MYKLLILGSFILVFTSYMSAQEEVKDINGNKYKVVKIGEQYWMAENLCATKFKNGDKIPLVKLDKEWKKSGDSGKPAMSYYENDIKNGKKFGGLYNWYAAGDKRGICPEGWHMPTQSELAKLKSKVNKDSRSLKATGQGGASGEGTNASGFSALLSGYRYDYGLFNYAGMYAYFWSITEFPGNSSAYYMSLYYYDAEIFEKAGDKHYGFNIRCVKD